MTEEHLLGPALLPHLEQRVAVAEFDAAGGGVTRSDTCSSATFAIEDPALALTYYVDVDGLCPPRN